MSHAVRLKIIFDLLYFNFIEKNYKILKHFRKVSERSFVHFFATCKVQIGLKFLGSPGKVWKNFSYQFLITKFSRLLFFRTTKD